jgi:hypothetical protein
VNYPLNDKVQESKTNLTKVFDYKKKFAKIVKNQLEICSEVRKILFEESDVKISLSLSSECDIGLYLF